MTSSVESISDRLVDARIPDFFIVGNPKSGTTALYEMLRSHPQIYMPDLKEPTFLASELPHEAHRSSLPGTLDDYLSLFACAQPGQRVGEASATYLWSATAPARIAGLAPAARIVAILREPAGFLRSLHLQNLRSHYESKHDLREAMALEQARREGKNIPRGCRRPQALLYSEYVRYCEQLGRYQEVLGREQMLVLIYDDFRRDNEGTVRRVLRFLDVDDELPVHVTDANPTVGIRSPQLDELLHTVSVGKGPLSRTLKASVKMLAPRRVRRGTLRMVTASRPGTGAPGRRGVDGRVAPSLQA